MKEMVVDNRGEIHRRSPVIIGGLRHRAQPGRRRAGAWPLTCIDARLADRRPRCRAV